MTVLYKHVKHWEARTLKIFLEFLFEKALCVVLQPTDTVHTRTVGRASCVDGNNPDLF
jgi:hypothetical protein